MKIKVSQTPNGVSVRFGDASSVYLLESELAPPTTWRECVFDLGTAVIVEPGRVVILPIPSPSEDGEERVLARVLHVDTAKLLRVLRVLKNKALEAEIDIARLRPTPEAPRQLTVTEIVRHSNAHGDMAATLSHFQGRIQLDQWTRLLCDLSRYLPKAAVYGQREEFYFDGRRPGGCGFNGGFIIHGDSYSIHT